MYNILIVCNAGMSSGMLARKMEDASKGEAKVRAVGVADFVNSLEGVDLILIGPQIRFQINEIKEGAGNIPVANIDPAKYGIMNGAGVLKDAYSIIERSK